MKAKNIKNLKPFKKGRDPRRNTKGQPRKLPALDQVLADCIDDDELKGIIEILLKKAKRGDIRAAELLLDRGYGKAKQTLEATLLPPVTFENATEEQEQLLREVIEKLNEIDNTP
jgi:hypothetical protein